jgi:hypothetical protein
MNFNKSNRFDNIPLVIGKNVQETAQGFLKVPAYTARTGIQKYRMDDGRVVKEYRPESEVFSKTSMDSLATAAVTNGHPTEMVNPDNAKELIVGFPQGGVAKHEDGFEKFLGTDLIITHRSAIEAIRKGKAQLSNGYHVDLAFEEGEYNNEKYDAIQKNIVNNHIAIVWRARGGENVRLRLDSNDGILINEYKTDNEQGEKLMKVKLGDKEFEVEDAFGKAFKEHMKKGKEDKEKDMNELKEKADSLELENEVLKSGKSKLVAKVDSLESDLEKKVKPEMPKEKFDAAVNERINVINAGKKMLSKEEVEKLDSMTNVEIKTAIIKADSPEASEEKLKNEAYVDARFDHIVENFSSADEAKKKLAAEVIKKRENNDGDEETYISPEQKRLDNMKKEQENSLGPIGGKE